MPQLDSTRIRLGAVALGLSSLLLAAFPLLRPFFPLDPRYPDLTLRLAAPSITSAWWVLSHLVAMLAFVLLVPGLLALYARLADGPGEPRALRALLFGLAGIALVMPMLGVETHVLPIIGTLYRAGATGIAPAVDWIYRGSAIAVFLLGLLLLAIGAIGFARVIRRTGVLPRRAGTLFALGLALWFPPFPRPVRVLDGLAIGAGGAWLAWRLWRDARAPRALHDSLPAGHTGLTVGAHAVGG